MCWSYVDFAEKIIDVISRHMTPSQVVWLYDLESWNGACFGQYDIHIMSLPYTARAIIIAIILLTICSVNVINVDMFFPTSCVSLNYSVILFAPFSQVHCSTSYHCNDCIEILRCYDCCVLLAADVIIAAQPSLC